MTDFEREDLDLKAIMGDKFIDETDEAKEEMTFNFCSGNTVDISAKKTPKCREANVAPKPSKEVDAEWHPKKERNWMDDLKDCAKAALIFGGLNILIWYWMATDLMAETIALPSMIVCACLMGLGIGKVMGGKK